MKPRRAWVALLGAFLLTTSVPAAQPPLQRPIREKEFRHPDLYVPEASQALAQLSGPQAAGLVPQASAFGAQSDTAFFDPRVGRWSSLIVREPLLPGAGNRLAWDGGRAPQGDDELKASAWNAVRAYLQRHQKDLGIDLAELEPTPRVSVHQKGSVIFVHAARVVNGIPVRDNAVSIAINHGNLVLLGLQNWGNIDVATVPTLSADAAQGTVRAYVSPATLKTSQRAAHLELIPMSGGAQLYYRLVWVVESKVEGDGGRWESLVDAGNGTLFAFEDRNDYATPGEIVGGVYPLANDQRPPDGQEQAGWPMPYVDYTTDGVKRYADGGGNIGCVPGSISTSLDGLYLKIHDNCGAVSETGTSGVDLGSGAAGTDCTVPAGHSAGDTKSARSGYYELNRIKEQARGHLDSPGDPAAAWVRGKLTANMNVNNDCNAFWDGEEVNFFRSSPANGCGNTGEIASIFDHEWGHGLDNNGVNPNIANPGEAIADTYAMLRLNTSCIGRGFFPNETCSGYGDACVGTPQDGCSGVRDIDYANHRCDQPHTISWILNGFTSAQCGGTGAAASCPAGTGPCGREIHCEGMVAAEAAWDLQYRDLRAAPFNYDANTAHEVATRLYYIGNQPITSLYTCSVGGGCSATGQYMSLLAADDDDGNIANGTPHMTAIRAAFERHEIHCASPAAVNSGCAGSPTEAPVVTLEARDRSIALSWAAVPNAAAYLVYRADGVEGCDMGKVIVADTTELSFVDEGLQNGRSYSYSVMPMGANAACSGPMSACATSAPVDGDNAVVLDGVTVSGGDGDQFLDNCETATVTFSVDNIGTGALTNVRIVGVTPVTHPASVIVTALPAPIVASLATCTVAPASFQVIPQGLVFDGTSDFLVEITADELAGQTRTRLLHIEHTESDLVSVASKKFGFDADRDGWVTSSGVFDRTPGAGANGTAAGMTSSSQADNACDVVRSPIILLSASSTLQMYVGYDIEGPSGGQFWDRANVGLVDVASGRRTTISPSSGRIYPVPPGAANGTCATAAQAGWDGTTPGFPTAYFQSAWTAAALNPGGAFTGEPVYLQVAYGTDAEAAGLGLHFDEVTLTNVSLQVPDAHAGGCGASGQAAPAGLAVDASGNGVLEAGETAVVSPAWTNTGSSAVALTGSASAFTGPAGPTYTLADGAGAYGDIAAGASAACTDCYSVTIDAATRPAMHWDATVTETVDPGATAKTWTLHVGGSFTDVPAGSPFYPSVETVLHNGVTAGCGGGATFCPAGTVTRQQMAVFLLKSLEGEDYAPPACVTQAFDDVPCASPFAAWINELASRGVTAGCGGANYCPTDPTNRQQMAVFLLKTKEGSSYAPPACSAATFGDVPCDSPFAPWIYELVNRGVTAGCGSGNYCPASSVARQQMAVFLVKTFGLALYGI